MNLAERNESFQTTVPKRERNAKILYRIQGNFSNIVGKFLLKKSHFSFNTLGQKPNFCPKTELLMNSCESLISIFAPKTKLEEGKIFEFWRGKLDNFSP